MGFSESGELPSLVSRSLAFPLSAHRISSMDNPRKSRWRLVSMTIHVIRPRDSDRGDSQAKLIVDIGMR